MDFKILVLFMFGCMGVAFSSNCQDLSGTWRNQLGSNMTLIHKTDTSLTGEYSTAVESKLNAAVVASNITGIFYPLEEGSLLSFTVLFNRGKSLATWAGQCLVCDGEEILFTSWILRSYIQKHADRWMAVRVNQDTFKRIPGEENTPHHLRIRGPWPKDARSSVCEKNIKAGVRGKWVAENGDVLDFEECLESGTFSGENQEHKVAGRTDGGDPFKALGFVSASNNAIKGWAGHIIEDSRDRKLDTTWLSHTFTNNCKDPRANLKMGMANYTYDTYFEDSAGTSWWQSFISYFNS